MGGATPKQFRLLAGKSVIHHTILGLLANVQNLTKIIIATHPEEAARAQLLLASIRKKVPVAFTAGGETRQDSVRAAIRLLDDDCELVLIHDAVRPLVSPETVERCIRAAARFGASVPGIPITATIKRVTRKNTVASTVDRNLLREIQTPQVFQKDRLIRAYQKAEEDGFYSTDDSSVVERTAGIVKVVKGDPWNIKITCPTDLLLAEALIRKMQKG